MVLSTAASRGCGLVVRLTSSPVLHTWLPSVRLTSLEGSMALDGTPLLLLTIFIAVASVIATLLVWNRRSPNGRWRWALGGLLILSCQLTALLVLSVAVNDSFGFYASWNDLLGNQQRLLPAGVPAGARDAAYRAQLNAGSAAGRGTVVPFVIPGSTSGVRPQPAFAYLPPQYGDPAYAHRSFPVVELLDGYPGSPQSWLQSLHIRQTLDGEIAAGRTVPMIAILPTQTVAPPRDTECVNVAHGAQVETYLTTDVRRAVLRDFRASAEPRAWAVMGYSTGGFCATNILLHDGTMFGSGVSLAGYFTAIQDASTGNLYGGSTARRLFDSPTWYGQHRRTSDDRLLIVGSREDPGAIAQVHAFLAHLRPSLRVSTLLLQHGGHNPAVWRAEEPACLDWLGHQLIAPLAAGWQIDDVPQLLPAHYHWHLPAASPHPVRP